MGFQMVHFSNKMDDILREKRVVQGLTQQQVADRAKISLRQYQSFESGERNIRTASFQLACRVIEALGMDPTKFFHDEYVIGDLRPYWCGFQKTEASCFRNSRRKTEAS